MKTFIHILCAGIFWIWNICFILLVYFGILPIGGFEFFRAMVDGTIPYPFVISLLGIMLVPPVCTFLGGWRLRKHPVLLLRLFYGVEAPLFGLCLLRLFLLRETTPASTYLLTVCGLAIATFAIELFFGYAAYRKPLAWFQMVTHSLVLMVGLYIGGILMFYTVPSLCVFLYSFFQFQWLGNVLQSLIHQPLESAFVGLIFIFLFGFSCTLFVAMPYVLVNIFLHSWGRIYQAFGRQHGWWQAVGISGGVAIATFALFLQTQHQPQTIAFALLDPPPQTQTERQAVLAEANTVRTGLVNAYLHAYRYLSPWEDSQALAAWYRQVFNLNSDQAQFWQTWHNHFFSPFLYQGDQADAERAANLYAQVFDEPIQKGERRAIQQALESTVNREETKAGLLNIDQHIVYLANQEVTVAPQGDWAEVTLYERYENPTQEDQEIFYSFSLPESAVITGLWLGEDGMAQRYPFVVSPRGAAQKVYNAEVDRGQQQPATDPALLEQVGPRQYRLRVFPIPRRIDARTPGRSHLWLTYKVMQQDGQWPLPQLTEKRSIFWDRHTHHRREGELTKLDSDTWFESGIPATPQPAVSHQVDFPEGYRVTATPVTSQPPALADQHLAVVLDTSYSMAKQRETLTTTLNELNRLAAKNQLDWYLTAANGGSPKAMEQVSLNTLAFYGSLQIDEMVQQFEQAQVREDYDAILLITDRGSYELAQNDIDLPIPTAPLWILHLGETLPAAYTDSVLQALQASHGGVATDFQALKQRLATEVTGNPTIASLADGYRWQVTPLSASAEQKPAEATFLPLAARQLILKLSRDGDMTQVEQLDAVHAIAQRAAIVTPYSSMLVLVNDRQREALREAELSSDRFNRQVEAGIDQLTQPNSPFTVASAPEPGAILGLGAIALILLLIKQRPNSLPL